MQMFCRATPSLRRCPLQPKTRYRHRLLLRLLCTLLTPLTLDFLLIRQPLQMRVPPPKRLLFR